MANAAPTPQRISDAIAHFEAQIGHELSPLEREEMTSELNKRAAVVGAAALMTLVSSVYKAIGDAEAARVPFEQLMADLPGSVRSAWQGTATKEPNRTGAVAKAFVFAALASGRSQGYKVYSSGGDGTDGGSAVNEVTYQRFDAVADDRTTEVCAECDGTVLAIEDPWWSAHTPPLHYGCRSILVQLTHDEAVGLGLTKDAPTAKAPEGFGSPDNAWQPAPEDYPKEIWAEYERQVAAAGGGKSEAQ